MAITCVTHLHGDGVTQLRRTVNLKFWTRQESNKVKLRNIVVLEIIIKIKVWKNQAKAKLYTMTCKTCLMRILWCGWLRQEVPNYLHSPLYLSQLCCFLVVKYAVLIHYYGLTCTQGCSKHCLAVNLLLGSKTINLLTRSCRKAKVSK